MTNEKNRLTKHCAVCGRKLEITIHPDSSYDGGHYFGKMNIPIGKGENVKIGEHKIGQLKYTVVKGTGKHKKVEYWECDDCYHKED